MILVAAALVHLALLGGGIVYARWTTHKEVRRGALIAFFPFTTNRGMIAYDVDKR